MIGLRRARADTASCSRCPDRRTSTRARNSACPRSSTCRTTARQDPTFFRTGGESYGRDGCRVPIPWSSAAAGAGFGPAAPTGAAASWLPQPHSWPDYARDAQRGIPGSTLEFYRTALAERRAHGLASNELVWLPSPEPAVLVFRSGAVTVVANTGTASVTLPALADGARVILESGPIGADVLPGDTTVWLLE